MELWEYAGYGDIRKHPGYIVRLITSLHDDYRNMRQKPPLSRRGTESFKKKEADFTSSLDLLFDNTVKSLQTSSFITVEDITGSSSFTTWTRLSAQLVTPPITIKLLVRRDLPNSRSTRSSLILISHGRHLLPSIPSLITPTPPLTSLYTLEGPFTYYVISEGEGGFQLITFD